MALAGHWNRGRVLGRGSTATVSLATASTSGEQFAVKSAELAGSSFLRREQKFLSSLGGGRCKNLVSYLGHGTTADGQYNVLLEYAPGGSLHDQIAARGGALAEAAVRFYARGILAGLAYLHSEKVVHCDVKTRNVLVGSDGQAKIADLGCARSFGEEEEEGQLQLRGTPMFMAPEVARGEGQGPEADVWAAGCVVVEMASGRAPWPEAADAMAVLHRIAFSGDVPSAPDRMSDEAKDFLSKCLRREPERRWTAAQLLTHPFLRNCESTSDPVVASEWISPKSVLDQRIWESLEEDDPAVPPRRMVPELLAVAGSSGPNWTWDEDWLTVRTDDEDYEAPEEAEQHQTVGGDDDDDSVNPASSSISEETVIINNAISTTTTTFSTHTYRTDADNQRPCFGDCHDFLLSVGGGDDIFCYCHHLSFVVGGDDVFCHCRAVVAWSDCNPFMYGDQFSNEQLLIDWMFARAQSSWQPTFCLLHNLVVLSPALYGWILWPASPSYVFKKSIISAYGAGRPPGIKAQSC